MALCAVALIGYIISAVNTYSKSKKIEPDKTANVNVMLSRCDNWEKIQTGKIQISTSDLWNIDGSTATIPITAELARQFRDATDKNVNGYVDHNTTHTAYENLIYTMSESKNNKEKGQMSFFKEKNLIFATEPSEDELSLASDNGVSLDAVPVARDGFVFIVNKDNPVNNLSTEQIQKIYSGKITNWKEVGGSDQKIIPYQREKNSGSQTAMEQLVMKDNVLIEPEAGYIINGMGNLIEVIAEYQNKQNSIGYTYYYYINNLYKNDNIKVLNIDGVSPDNENLIDKTYPFTTSYYAVIAENGDQKAKEIRDYMISDEGQKIISMAGYCPVKNQVK